MRFNHVNIQITLIFINSDKHVIVFRNRLWYDCYTIYMRFDINIFYAPEYDIDIKIEIWRLRASKQQLVEFEAYYSPLFKTRFEHDEIAFQAVSDRRWSMLVPMLTDGVFRFVGS